MPIKGVRAEDVPARFRPMFEANPWADHFDLEIVEMRPGASLLRFPYEKRYTQYQGALQGGIVTAYADAAIAVAMTGLVPEGRDLVTTDLHVQFMRPVTAGPILARAEVTHAGETLLLGAATVEIEGGAVCARCAATYMLIGQRPPGR
jgi:acyl-CoA thioesterase